MHKLIVLLEDLAAILEPFARTASIGSRTWDGHEYAPVTEPHEPDPSAVVRCVTLRTVASLLESQPSISPEQYTYLKSAWFGGMGSVLNDFSLDTRRHGKPAEVANQRFRALCTELYSCLQSLKPDASKT
jgi:hypothetical protein